MLSQQKIKSVASKLEIVEMCMIEATWTQPNQVKFENFFWNQIFPM